MPTPSRYLPTRSAPRLVRVKMRARAMRVSSNSSASSWRLRSDSTNSTRCSIVVTVVAEGATEAFAGFWSSSSASLPISPGMVAEKNRFWRCFGKVATMRRIGGKKPRSSI